MIPYLPYFAYGLAAISLVTAGVLAYRKADGWGWFLIVAVVLVPASKIPV